MPLQKRWWLPILMLCCAPALQAQKQDKKLQKVIEQMAAGFGGQVGIYVKDLKSGKVAAYNADSIFPTASIVKIPIAVGIMQKLERGELTYHQPLVYTNSLLYPGVDILGSFKNGEQIDLSKVLMLMLTTSDNTASLWLQSLAGGGTRINALMDTLGFAQLRVNSRTAGREAYREVYGWGQMTPRAISGLMEEIYRRRVISPAASDRLLRLLNRNYWDAEALSQIAPDAAVFSKNGAVNESRSEVVLVRGKRSAYQFCIATKNNRDQSWTPVNEAWTLTRKLSAYLWRHFEGNGWTPADGADKFH